MEKSDYEPCLCGHDAGFHFKQWTNIGGPTNVIHAYLQCEWNEMNRWGETVWGADAACKCKLFRRDNLVFLERLNEQHH